MPIYLIHGFRWPRKPIRVHVILNNIDDASPDCVMRAGTQAALMSNFRTLYPDIMAALPNLQFVEQLDPADDAGNATSQPYAFVVDKMEQSNLSINVEAVMGQGVSAARWDALADLRDKLAPGEKIGWWVVYNGDPERAGLGDESLGNDGEKDEGDDDEKGIDDKKGKSTFRKWLGRGSSKT